jgi:hypothetical protein
MVIGKEESENVVDNLTLAKCDASASRRRPKEGQFSVMLG